MSTDRSGGDEGGTGVAEFDVIVIGAGASGAPLASRLSERPDRRVLLVEAGSDHPSTEDFPRELLDSGLMAALLPGHPNNWGFLANLTPDLPYVVARGRILGGSTTLNGTYFIRGRRADFDRWVDAGLHEWSYEKVLPFYKRIERDLQYGDSDLHGGSGPITITREIAHPHPVTEAFAEACASRGYPFEADKNGEQPAGYGPLPVNAVDGIRLNTGIAYVNPARRRPNFDVLGNTRALRVLLRDRAVVGIEIDTDGERRTITAGEVVLSAGAIMSPQLLALSGIGPRAELEAAGIPVILDLPAVGKGFTDHPDLSFTWRSRRPIAPVAAGAPAFESVLNFASSSATYGEDLEIMPSLRSLADIAGLAAGVGRDHTATARMVRHPVATLRALRGVSLRRLLAQAAHRNELFFSIALQQAEARGTITTVSADPLMPPRIEYNYLSTTRDLARMREVVHVTVDLLTSSPFAGLFGELGELDRLTLEDDDALDGWMRSHLATAIHASSSCRMGAADDPEAVVDQQGRVHGVTGLRVADTSILPGVPSRGPAATAIMIGERIASFIDQPGNTP
ncbi:GMC family oxidoreductase [Frankia sp. AgKG'84/4]|uniref:GMC family oxidoreductase n=1 Tax=Frankia sp. AgKG'84/4 TaxID=573490 RepID=UPI00200E5DC2|nr:GMC family oxidoreductase N-terminal domain-containing protein [Frankia sp. AgKG'84/4]MCL9794572.1 FAD-dependent oxidoreductase [Frankia sp. AgKG'84/4]